MKDSQIYYYLQKDIVTVNLWNWKNNSRDMQKLVNILENSQNFFFRKVHHSHIFLPSA
jgi:hypothetical protein